jgi:hypothetical protein
VEQAVDDEGLKSQGWTGHHNIPDSDLQILEVRYRKGQEIFVYIAPEEVLMHFRKAEFCSL